MEGEGYLDHRWATLNQLKSASWLELQRSRSPRQSIDAAAELRLHAIALHPGWPTERDRQRDLDFHQRLSERMRRASPP